MRKLLLCALLTTPLLSCGANCPEPAIPRPLAPCVIPARPVPPELPSLPNLNISDLVALADYVRANTEVELALARCSLVVRQ